MVQQLLQYSNRWQILTLDLFTEALMKCKALASLVTLLIAVL